MYCAFFFFYAINPPLTHSTHVTRTHIGTGYHGGDKEFLSQCLNREMVNKDLPN